MAGADPRGSPGGCSPVQAGPCGPRVQRRRRADRRHAVLSVALSSLAGIRGTAIITHSADRERRSLVPAGPTAGQISDQLHQIDLVGPIYLKGSGHRYYIWVGKDSKIVTSKEVSRARAEYGAGLR